MINKSPSTRHLASSLGLFWGGGTTYTCMVPSLRSSADSFLQGVNETRFIFALLAFAAGFAVRPFGALIFGRLAILGRQDTLSDQIVIMGGVDCGSRHAANTHPSVLLRPSFWSACGCAGSCTRWRIWWRRNLCCRTRASRQTRFNTSWIQTTATLVCSIVDRDLAAEVFWVTNRVWGCAYLSDSILLLAVSCTSGYSLRITGVSPR